MFNCFHYDLRSRRWSACSTDGSGCITLQAQAFRHFKCRVVLVFKFDIFVYKCLPTQWNKQTLLITYNTVKKIPNCDKRKWIGWHFGRKSSIQRLMVPITTDILWADQSSLCKAPVFRFLNLKSAIFFWFWKHIVVQKQTDIIKESTSAQLQPLSSTLYLIALCWNRSTLKIDLIGIFT